MEVDYRLDVFGGDEPEVLIIGGVHGDEPSGVFAVETVRDQLSTLNKDEILRPIGLLVANPRAATQDKRYLEADLNRSFPGDSQSTLYEERLAAAIYPLIDSADVVLALHSTHSSDEPFGLLSKDIDTAIQKAVFHMSISKVVVSPFADGRGSLVQFPHTLEVEAGFQHSESAKKNALSLSIQFLSSQNALSEESCLYSHVPWTDIVAFELEEMIDKQGETELFVDNFTAVESDEEYARSDEKQYISDTKFSPVLMSENGYDSILGFKSTNIGWLSRVIDGESVI